MPNNIITVSIPSSLSERVERQVKRWMGSNLQTMSKFSRPSRNSFLRTAIEVYVENMESMTDEELREE